MPQYIIEVSEENDAKLRSVFPDPELLFKKVVADAVQDADGRAAEAFKPEVVRISDEDVAVVKVKDGAAVDMEAVAEPAQPIEEKLPQKVSII